MGYVSGKVFAGQIVGLTTVAMALASGSYLVGIREVLVQSDPANTTNVLVGSANDQYVQLTPGQSISIPVHGLDLIYVAMMSGLGTVNFLARD